MDTMLLRDQFPDFDVATLPEIPSGFEDVSWRNDACPAFASSELGLVIWVDYPMPAQREFPESPRFCLKGNDPHIFFVASDDFGEILAEIERLPRLTAEDRGDLTDEQLQGWLAFWANERLIPERGSTLDYQQGWWRGHRRAYAMGASDCRTNFERGFAQFSAPWEAWGSGWNDEAAGLIPAREPEVPQTEAGVVALAEEALNAAALLIQERLGVPSGDFAAMVFSGNEVRDTLAAYIRGEIAQLPQESRHALHAHD